MSDGIQFHILIHTWGFLTNFQIIIMKLNYLEITYFLESTAPNQTFYRPREKKIKK